MLKKIVIEIDDNFLAQVKKFVKDGCFNYAEQIIANGKPLEQQKPWFEDIEKAIEDEQRENG